ncbi:sel1 repeat family protein [Thiorhodococcus mannitoliphagus]|uniref:Sel1 repeat family protein n=1 Tax=Thiorhodococcus mannitoliphagus TaxID=329406 RepID=A0A6P1DY21_9GAMM|nr:sel1 repeat family protein [Thiorhodococcus mannitoliphagus]
MATVLTWRENKMPSICLNTAISITGLSRRTLWRRIGEGGVATLGTHGPGEETRLSLDDVLPLSSLPLKQEDRSLILAADDGDAESQCCLALVFFTAHQPAEAVRWLTRAAKQLYPDAMCYLGRCYLSGEGIERDDDAGILWLSQAAAKGYPLAQQLMRFLLSPKGQQLLAAHELKALDAALDDVERQVLMKALVDTGQPRGDGEGAV